VHLVNKPLSFSLRFNCKPEFHYGFSPT
jgi:hypothetical protein